MCLKFSKNIGKAIFVSAALLSPVATMAAPAFYIQGQGGLSSWNAGEDSSRIDFKGNTYTWRVSGGSLWNTATPWQYGVEAGIANYPRLARETDDYSIIGQNMSETMTLKGYSIDLLGVAKYNFNRQFNAFGKVGFAYLHETINDRILFGDVVSSESRSAHTVAPEVALGVAYKVMPNLEANLGVNAIFAGSSDFTNVMTTTAGLTAGLTYYFS
jgi:opacity protein-like surface antigen